MPQENREASDSQGRLQPVHLTAIALRSAGQLYDMNVSATRLLLQTQARAAAAFGLPDWSPLFDNADERVRHVFSTGAEQVLNTAQRTNEAVSELQRHVGRVIETQASQAAESWQRGLEELGNRANDSLSQLCETARKTAEEAQRNVQQLGEQFRDNVKRTSDELRSQQQQGSNALRQAVGQAGDGAREAGQSASQAQPPQSADQRRPKPAANA
jgi:ElaB/YqjD/DUF883 family membrane-anchored ribosome-binding protein